MLPYQEEYMENLQTIQRLAALSFGEGVPFAAWYKRLCDNQEAIRRLRVRNMELLRTEYQWTIDHLFDRETHAQEDLTAFAAALEGMDEGLSCTTHQALLSYYRMTKNLDGIIEELYKRGMGLYNQSRPLIHIHHPALETLDQRFRMYFAEAGAYLKYFDEIPSETTKGYIIRSMANTSLGRFRQGSEKVAIVRRTLKVLNDDWYHQLAPDLPWDRFIYLTHQQMLISRTVSPSSKLSPEDIADILESSYIVYEAQIEHTRNSGEKPNPQWLWPRCELEYISGLITAPEMLSKMESLMELVDEDDYSVGGMYGRITLPMIYFDRLKELSDPDLFWKKQDYLCHLNHCTLRYVLGLPLDKEHNFYLNQFISSYMELGNSPPYEQVLMTLLPRCAPDIYVHSCVVADAAEVLGGAILADNPRAFDDIPAIGKIEDPTEKQAAALRFVHKSGMLHDVGAIFFHHIRAIHGREMFREEHETLELHTIAGYEMLKNRASTRDYADIALGHHAWYDGSNGYPKAYQRQESPFRQAVDVIAMAVFLEDFFCQGGITCREDVSFMDAVAQAAQGEGRRFFPPLVVCLQDPKIQEKLQNIYFTGREKPLQQIYLQAGGG